MISNGTPDEIKADLVEEYVLVDTRGPRGPESGAGSAEPAVPRGDGAFRLELDGRGVHEILRAIERRRSAWVKTHTPSLEDAYLEIVSRTGE